MAKSGELNARQAAFVREYLVDKNATQAAIRAGYSADTASQQGERLLRNVEIRAAVSAALGDIAERTGITAERILRERARLAFFDVRKLYDKDGMPIPLNELDEDTAAAIVGVEVLEQFIKDGDDRILVGYVKKYRLATKDASLAALEKYFGLNEKKIRHALPPIATAEDCAIAQAGVVAAVAAGALLPSEGQVLSGLIEHQRRALETTTIAAKLDELLANPGIRRMMEKA